MPKKLASWEVVTTGVGRLPVPGGWLYSVGQNATVTFVPDPEYAYKRAEQLSRSIMEETRKTYEEAIS
jgi:hypothetical protein